jgi:CRP-like cAMP-binding protein
LEGSILPPRSPNRLLAALPSTELEWLAEHLHSVELVRDAVLARTGEPLTRAYFPHSGIVSLVVTLAEGELVEVAMVGRDGIIGVSAAFDNAISMNNAIVALSGSASMLDVADLQAAAERSASFRHILIRHQQTLFAQAQQSAACNAVHSVEARMSRWLLRARDVAGSDTLALTQEFLARMLGVQRDSVSLVAHSLQQAGLIRYHRGHIEITNVEALMESACECYATTKAHYDRLLGDNAGRQTGGQA